MNEPTDVEQEPSQVVQAQVTPFTMVVSATAQNDVGAVQLYTVTGVVVLFLGHDDIVELGKMLVREGNRLKLLPTQEQKEAILDNVERIRG